MFLKTIIDEMLLGNFSFLILIVGVAQLVVMILKGQKKKMKTKDEKTIIYCHAACVMKCEKCGATFVRERTFDIGDTCPGCGRKIAEFQPDEART